MNGANPTLTLFRPGTLTAECIEDCVLGWVFAIGAARLPFWLMAMVLGSTLMDRGGNGAEPPAPAAS